MKKLFPLALAFRHAAIALQAEDIGKIQSDFSIPDPDFSYTDRGEMYLRTYITTGSEAGVSQGSISTFSGSVEGAAYLVRLLAATAMNIGNLLRRELLIANNQKQCAEI